MRMGNKHSTRDAKTASPAVSRNGSRKSCPAVDVFEISPSSTQSTSQPASALERYQQSVDDATAQPIQLSAYQKAILRDAWQRISKKGTSNIGSLIFRRMMNKNSDIKKLFQHVTGMEGVFSFGLTPIKVYRHHSVLFVKVLDSAIANLDDLRPFVLECVAYGEKHGPYRKYGFSPDMWDVFGECMTEAAREWEGWKKHRETLRAWTILISFIVDRMRQGYESAVRKDTFMKELAYVKPEAPDTASNEQGASEDKKDISSNEARSQILQQASANVVATPKGAKWRRQSNAVINKSPIITRSKSALDIHAEQLNDIDVQI